MGKLNNKQSPVKKNTVLKGQVLSPVQVCEESEVTTNIQLYEI